MTYQPQSIPADHPPQNTGKVGVLLTNLGTPDAAEPKAVKRYLKQFLSDSRVIEIPQIAWQPILRGIILNTRPRKSAKAYAKVWREDGSPLAAITKAQAVALQERLGDQVHVDYAMRYGSPAIGDQLSAMHAAGCERIVLAPLYPQYCAATTATAVDEAGRALSEMRWQPSLRTLPPYFDDPGHIAALHADIRRQLAELAFTPEVLLLSFHGMPEATLHKGDPYHCHCRKTARLLTEALADDAMTKGIRIETSFQSRFGPAKWLGPATDDTLEKLAGEGTENIAVVAPGFSADCVETLEELAIEGREQFIEAGGENYAVLECLNDGAIGMDMIEALVRRELAGWIPA